jgi:hypothetical protein
LPVRFFIENSPNLQAGLQLPTGNAYIGDTFTCLVRIQAVPGHEKLKSLAIARYTARFAYTLAEKRIYAIKTKVNGD